MHNFILGYNYDDDNASFYPSTYQLKLKRIYISKRSINMHNPFMHKKYNVL